MEAQKEMRPAFAERLKELNNNGHTLAGREFPDNGTLVDVVTMTPAQWHAVPDNPRQRNTAKHAERADHLLVPHPRHANVDAGLLPDGTMVKLDAHTRDYNWHEGRVPPPPFVRVSRYHVDDLAAAAELYMTFDNKAAADNSNDLLYGICREQNLDLSSDLLRHHKFATALRVANAMWSDGAVGKWSDDRLVELVSEWNPELQLLDSCDTSKRRWYSTSTAGALILLKAYGAPARKFISAIQNDEGLKQANRKDAVQACRDYLSETKLKKQTEQQRSTIIRTMVACYHQYMRGGTYSTVAGAHGARPISEKNFREWVENMKIRNS